MHATPAPHLMKFFKSCMVGLTLVLLLMAITSGGGCARPSTSDWAQTSPIMNADKTTSAVNLGARD